MEAFAEIVHICELFLRDRDCDKIGENFKSTTQNGLVKCTECSATNNCVPSGINSCIMSIFWFIENFCRRKKSLGMGLATLCY
ncbi:UNVERIFIED_CONTAM: hypothetical protein FKN15_054313 [Acipenser sinensis]